jgi:hypothetical protein
MTPFQLPLIHISDNLTLLAWQQSQRVMGCARKTGVIGNYADWPPYPGSQ